MKAPSRQTEVESQSPNHATRNRWLQLPELWRRLAMAGVALAATLHAQPYLDNQTQYSNQDPNTETRRSDHFRAVFGHYDRDGANKMSEQYVQGNLQLFEQCWNRWVVELGMHDINESSNPTYVDGNKYRANFNFLMTWNDGGGGGAYSSSDAHGFFYCMANPANDRYDPPSGTTPHEFGHVWEGSAAGFNGSTTSGAWWECTANWMMLQAINTYPQAGGYLYNSVLYPAHGRDYYDSWVIWEAAKDDPRYGAAWVNNVWTNFNADQQVNEYIIDRMIRVDSSGSADKAGALKDLWGDMAKKMVTWDFARQRWLASANTPWNGDTWEWYTRCRTPMVKMPGTSGTYRPAREHMPQQFGFHFVPLTATPGTTVSCGFQPLCDPVRQSDWRACLVAVSSNGEARYSSLWNTGTNSLKLSGDETQLYLVVIAVPKPMRIVDPAWREYTRDSGLQFPYLATFVNATPSNVTYPAQSRTGMHQHSNGGGWVSDSAVVDATAYVGPNAQVLNSAQVRGTARIEEYAVVRNNAQVRDNAVVSGHGMVYENAKVYGNAKVRDWAMVFGYAELYENAKAIEHAGCGGGDASSHNRVYGDVVLKGITSVYNPSTFSGSLICDGDTANGGTGDHGVHFGWQWGQNPSIFTGLTNNNYQYCGLTFERDNAVFACDELGINHGYLMNGCRSTVDSGGSLRGGYVLPLNGTNQYVELHNSVNDFKTLTLAVWAKWTGSTTDQRIWSLGDGTNNVLFLTPKSTASNKLRVSISDGTTTQTVDGTAALGTGWTHLAVTFSGTTAILYVNGAPVGTNASLTLQPDSLNAPLMENANYLGRGNGGNYFQGSLDDFRVYNKALSAAEVFSLYNTAAPSTVTPVVDITAPAPNAATWLVAPLALNDNAVTMSATPGTDASGWVEYYFTCSAGGGHDSGWVSFNKYTDVGLSPGTSYSYTVKMRDRNGNTTAASASQGATTQVSSAGTASFAYGPVGIDSSSIKMTATKLSSPSGLVEYKFTRNDSVTSGWQASPTWINTSLTAGNNYTYTVQVRDGRGNTSAVSAAQAATATDMAAPELPISVAHWIMQPYPTIDNRISMTAMDASDASGVQYYFECVSGGAADSGWQDSPTYVTPVLADGTYSFHYKLRDKSAQTNASGYSTTYSATIKPTTGYHTATFAQLFTHPDDYLVSFNGLVLRANADHYLVKDVASGATIKVTTAAYGQATDSNNSLKICNIKGHLYTYGTERMVTYSTVTALMDAPSFAVSGTVTSTAGGTPIPGATVSFSDSPNARVNPIGTTTTDINGNYSMPLPNGSWYVAVAAPNFFGSPDQSATVNGYPVGSVDFILTPAFTISASAGAGGTISPAGDALVSEGGSQSYTIATSAGYSIEDVLVDGTSVGSVASYTFNGVSVNHTIAVTFTSNTRNVPQTSNLIASAVTDTFPDSGNTGAWASYLPAGQSYTAMGSPTVTVLNGAKWAHNVYADGDGYRCGTYAAPISCNGASAVMVVKPARNATGTSWTSCLDVFYDRLVLGVKNDTGKIVVRRNGSLDLSSGAIPDGQITVLSLVVQPDGKYRVYANGTLMMDITSTSPMTTLTNGVAGAYANAINIGRNNPDGWTVFNGEIGDTFLYKVALSDAERQQLEADLNAKFGGASGRTITASAGTGGSISPAGAINVANGGTAKFVAQPEIGYAVSQLTVDGVSQGAISAYTFTNVTTSHTIAVTFAAVPTYTLTASAGTGGSINPAGSVIVNSGSSKTFTITPNPGWSVAQVTLDGASQGAITSYTFNNITANHTIAATFAAQTFTIASSAATGGAISPSGAVSVNYGGSQSFTITPSANHAVSSVLVDGVDVGPVTSYTFDTVLTNHTISAVFIAGSRNIPAADQLIFGIDTKDIPASGAITSWPWLWPTGTNMAAIASPTAETLNSVKWERNVYAEGDGLRAGRWSGAIPCNGASVLIAIKPTRSTDTGNWRSLVDVFYDKLVLGIANDTGLVCVRRNGNHTWAPTGTEIPNGQITVLSLIAQPDGTYKVWANGTLIMNIASTSALTSLNPDHTAVWGSDPDYTHYITIGRNNPDGWTTFNGNIGDAFLYNVALSDDQRLRLEADLRSKFAGVTGGYTITASAAPGGSISPTGAVPVSTGGSQAFTITPNSGYSIADVQIDSISIGVAGSYTFENVLANHTLAATFTATGAIPDVPAGLAAAGANAVVSLTWNAASGATGYNVKRSTVSGSGYVQVGTSATPSYSDTTVANGTTYYYVVSATNSIGESANSSEISVTPVAPPVITGQPSSRSNNSGTTATFTVTATGATLSYQWLKNGSPISDGGNVSGATAATLALASVTQADAAGYSVVVSNPGGSVTSAVATLTVVDFPPAPANLSATPGYKEVSLSWNAASGATSYNLKRATVSGGPYTVITNVTTLAQMDAGLVNGTTYYYVVSAVNAAGEGPDSSPVSAMPSGLPAPWLTTDIGAVGIAGNAWENAGVYTVNGSGKGIANGSDEFRYVYQTMNGDGSIVARISSQSGTSASALVGVMIRETTNSNSRFAMTTHRGSGTSNMRALRRSSTGGNVSSTSSSSRTPPNCWVRIIRTGNSFAMAASSDGTTWTTINTSTLTMAANITVGLVATSGSDTALDTDVFDNITVVP